MSGRLIQYSLVAAISPLPGSQIEGCSVSSPPPSDTPAGGENVADSDRKRLASPFLRRTRSNPAASPLFTRSTLTNLALEDSSHGRNAKVAAWMERQPNMATLRVEYAAVVAEPHM